MPAAIAGDSRLTGGETVGRGESYAGIRKGPVNVEGRPVLVEGAPALGRDLREVAARVALAALALQKALALEAVHQPRRGRTALPGETFYPVREVLRTVGLAPASTEEVERFLRDQHRD